LKLPLIKEYTYLQGELAFNLDDYGKKESVTTWVSGAVNHSLD